MVPLPLHLGECENVSPCLPTSPESTFEKDKRPHGKIDVFSLPEDSFGESGSKSAVEALVELCDVKNQNAEIFGFLAR